MTAQDKDRIQNAIRHIQTAVDVDPWAIEIAVKAMEKEISALKAQEEKTQLSAEGTTSDLISRQDAIDVCDNAIDLWHGQLGEGIVIAVKKKIEKLLPAQPEIEERTEEFSQNVQNEDLISRKAAIEAMSESLKRVFPEHRQIAEKCLKALPSAQPERKKGWWTKDCACEICGFKPWYERDIHTLSFCPNCGADMRGDDDDQSK